MSGLFDEDAETYRTKNRSHKQYRDEATELISSKRMTLVAYSKNDYKTFIGFLKENEDLFRYHLSNDDKELLRAVCQRVWMRDDSFKDKTLEDQELFDRVFGYYIPGKTGVTVMGQPKVPRIEKELSYFSQATYETFYKWLSNPDTIKELSFNSNLKSKLKRAISSQKSCNKRIGIDCKGYEPQDEALFKQVLGDMYE